MGSSEDTSNKGIDPSVGGLVWVRRRNGSWWPGQILGPEELPESCLVSPKSGTPVKLLGREDASVDWYNLEKSKRVKAFRCGEYDECIKKAKAAAANASKKVVKYARREDAIIHALELENARLSNGHEEVCSKMDFKDHESHNEESPSSVHSHDDSQEMANTSTSNNESDSVLEFSQSGVSFEDPNHFIASKEQSACGTRRRTPNDSEDDGTEGVKRMRGLDDLGLGVASSFKRKRSQVARVHEFLKRKRRRRPLTQVLENTMVTVPIMCEELAFPTGLYIPGASDNKVSGLEYDESKRNPSVVINNPDSTVVPCKTGTLFNGSEQGCNTSLVKFEVENQASSTVGYLENGSSDKLFDVPLVAEENHSAVQLPILSCASQKPQFVAGAQQGCQVEAISFRIDELNESGSTSSGAAEMNSINHRMEKGAAEWLLKGKRNTRHAGKSKKQEDRSIDIDGESDGYLVGKDYNRLDPDGSAPVKSKPISEIQVNEFRGWTRSHREPHTRGLTAEFPQRLLPYRQSRFTVNPKYDPSDFSLRHHLVDNSLYDVNVEVQSSNCRPHHVPYISLMSKLSGRPIVGHPLTIEVLDDGFGDHLLNSSEFHSDQCEMDDDLGQEEMADLPSGMPTKHHTFQSHVSRNKSFKSKRNGVLSKKMRKLSSLTCSHRQIDDDPKGRMEKLKVQAVACVPLMVVFSRINAAFTSSTRPTHRRLVQGNNT